MLSPELHQVLDQVAPVPSHGVVVPTPACIVAPFDPIDPLVAVEPLRPSPVSRLRNVVGLPAGAKSPLGQTTGDGTDAFADRQGFFTAIVLLVRLLEPVDVIHQRHNLMRTTRRRPALNHAEVAARLRDRHRPTDTPAHILAIHEVANTDVGPRRGIAAVTDANVELHLLTRYWAAGGPP